MSAHRKRFPEPCEPRALSSWRDPWDAGLAQELSWAVKAADRGDWADARAKLLVVLLATAGAVEVCEARMRGEMPQ